MQLVLTGLGALIMVAICALSLSFIIAEQRRGHGAEAAPKDRIGVRDISALQVDPKPLSLGEVFPGPEIRLVSGAEPYRIAMTHIDTDCNIATTGTLGGLLDDDGCTQVVRAGMTAPYGGYLVTAGVFNLTDAGRAKRAGDQVGTQVENGAGGFAAMTTGLPGADATQPLSQLGWRDRGHFLIYCVVTRPDGHVVRDDDPYARRISADLVESYLSETVVGKRTLSP